MLQQRWEAKICRKETLSQPGIELTTTRSWVSHAHQWASTAGNDTKREAFWKHCRKKKKILVTSIFSFSYHVFYPIKGRHIIRATFILLSANAFNLVISEILSFGSVKGLHYLTIYLVGKNWYQTELSGSLYACLWFYAISTVFQISNGDSSQIHVSWNISNQYLTSPLFWHCGASCGAIPIILRAKGDNYYYQFFKDFGQSRPGIEPTTSRSWGRRSNHKVTAAVVEAGITWLIQ